MIREVINYLFFGRPQNSAASTGTCLPAYYSQHIQLTLSHTSQKGQYTPNLPQKICTLLLQSKKLCCQQQEKRTVTENQQDLERKCNVSFLPLKEVLNCHVKCEKQILQRYLPVPKLHHHTVLIVYNLLFFSFLFCLHFVIAEGEQFFIPHDTLGRCTCNLTSDGADLHP